MPEWVVQHWAKWVFGIIATGLTSLALYVRNRFKRIGAIETALRASLYDRLYYLHGKYIKQGWILVPDLANITGIYEGYHALGGNGVGTILYKELCALPKVEPEEDT